MSTISELIKKFELDIPDIPKKILDLEFEEDYHSFKHFVDKYVDEYGEVEHIDKDVVFFYAQDAELCLDLNSEELLTHSYSLGDATFWACDTYDKSGKVIGIY